MPALSEIFFPQMSGDANELGVLVEWRVPNGQKVAPYQVVAEVTVNKFDAEINSPAAGTLSWLVAAGEEVRQGDPIATVD
ncbi:biotin attachment protein [Arthrobacter psychrochitiniphilus]|uniref:Biotin attachment protein n=1 Tax=Arthrobacter psychrochitiniphilus TaxID=291045 RepID=A0A2V3DVW8_9MICC|nr:biotin attachment protein [Arthrobacter psychrochitiniphilus]